MNGFESSPVKNWQKILEQESSLDPEDWTSPESIGHDMISAMVEYLKTIDQKPIWAKPPYSLMTAVNSDWNEHPIELNKIYNSSQFKPVPLLSVKAL